PIHKNMENSGFSAPAVHWSRSNEVSNQSAPAWLPFACVHRLWITGVPLRALVGSLVRWFLCSLVHTTDGAGCSKALRARLTSGPLCGTVRRFAVTRLLPAPFCNAEMQIKTRVFDNSRGAGSFNFR